MAAQHRPFDRGLSEAEAEAVCRSSHYGWPGGTFEEARDIRQRNMRIGLERDEPTSGSMAAGYLMLGAAAVAGVIAGATLAWWLT
ncbi:hypothetical protein [Paracoccus beibuensis]|uniref:hypothetical protein n=1 Tax=Paracoccus beibuensis TaxID=547602 RepID=UPI002240CCB0|nr:hypothetical protein [Paracoccus beibuensis]